MNDASQRLDEVTDTDAAALIALVDGLRRSSLRPRAQGVARLADQLQADPAQAERCAAYIERLLLARRHRYLFAEVGIFESAGFFSALRRRLTARLLPPVPNPLLLRDLFASVFHHRDDRLWVDATPNADWLRLARLLGLGDPRRQGVQHLRGEVLEAARILTHRIAAGGLEPELIEFYPPMERYESAFLALSGEFTAWSAGLQQPGAMAADVTHLGVLLDQCKSVLNQVQKRARVAGASVALTYLTQRMQQMIDRLDLLLELLSRPLDATHAELSVALFCDLVHATCERNSVGVLVTRVTDLLALRVTEHASQTGEHYVAEDRCGYFAMLRAAMGAGLIVAFMALLKILTVKMHLPPFWEALAFSFNYAGGFVLVHLLRMAIATKQPAMTAATIAATVDQQLGSGAGLSRLVELVVQVSRTQFIAIIGNVVVALPMAVVLAGLWQASSGAPVADGAKAAHMLHEINPFASLALLYAATAGVFLFLAGLISGYYDNFCLYARLPERVAAAGWVRALLGEPRAVRLGEYLRHNLGALAGNIAFGFMLGFAGFVGVLLGWPVDIRHVTFSAANLGYALVTLDFQPGWVAFLSALAGVLLIGVTNLAVSFSLALYVAMKSRQIRFDRSGELIRLLLRRLADSPRSFFLPPGRRAA
jgi:site-specific recombinase